MNISKYTSLYKGLKAELLCMLTDALEVDFPTGSKMHLKIDVIGLNSRE